MEWWEKIIKLFDEGNKHQLVFVVTYPNRSPTRLNSHRIIFREEQEMNAKVVFEPYIICLILYYKMFHNKICYNK